MNRFPDLKEEVDGFILECPTHVFPRNNNKNKKMMNASSNHEENDPTTRNDGSNRNMSRSSTITNDWSMSSNDDELVDQSIGSNATKWTTWCSYHPSSTATNIGDAWNTSSAIRGSSSGPILSSLSTSSSPSSPSPWSLSIPNLHHGRMDRMAIKSPTSSIMVQEALPAPNAPSMLQISRLRFRPSNFRPTAPTNDHDDKDEDIVTASKDKDSEELDSLTTTVSTILSSDSATTATSTNDYDGSYKSYHCTSEEEYHSSSNSVCSATDATATANNAMDDDDDMSGPLVFTNLSPNHISYGKTPPSKKHRVLVSNIMMDILHANNNDDDDVPIMTTAATANPSHANATTTTSSTPLKHNHNAHCGMEMDVVDNDDFIPNTIIENKFTTTVAATCCTSNTNTIHHPSKNNSHREEEEIIYNNNNSSTILLQAPTPVYANKTVEGTKLYVANIRYAFDSWNTNNNNDDDCYNNASSTSTFRTPPTKSNNIRTRGGLPLPTKITEMKTKTPTITATPTFSPKKKKKKKYHRHNDFTNNSMKGKHYTSSMTTDKEKGGRFQQDDDDHHHKKNIIHNPNKEVKYSPEILNLFQRNKENRRDFHSSSHINDVHHDVEGPPSVQRRMMETDFLF